MEKELRQLFKNRADAYLNTIDESVEQGMSEDMFIKTMKEALAISRVVGRSEQLVCPCCGSKNIEMNSKWGDFECKNRNCGRIWAK